VLAYQTIKVFCFARVGFGLLVGTPGTFARRHTNNGETGLE